MKPFKVAVPLAKWLLRLALAAFLILNYINVFLEFQVGLTVFWVATLFMFFSVLLILGGMMKQASLTLISGFLIFALSIVVIIMIWSGSIFSIYDFFMPAAIGFYFFTRGNQG